MRDTKAYFQRHRLVSIGGSVVSCSKLRLVFGKLKPTSQYFTILERHTRNCLSFHSRTLWAHEIKLIKNNDDNFYHIWMVHSKLFCCEIQYLEFMAFTSHNEKRYIFYHSGKFRNTLNK